MSKVAKADWAASTPWLGISGKPASFGVSDIGQLTGIGFSVGQVPRWNGSKFVPYTIPSNPTPPPTPGVLPAPIGLTWDIPELLPLQTATEDFNVGNIYPGSPVSVTVGTNPGFFFFDAIVTGIEVVTLYALNMSGGPVTLGSTNFTLQKFS
ncbi:MAG TPA: hypothetical protein VHS96_08905 [Bacteroidia bacterium]|nr:hypothetical protein [Bacteroidia bacterium]